MHDPSTFRSVTPPTLTESSGSFQPRATPFAVCNVMGSARVRSSPPLGIAPTESHESCPRIDHKLHRHAIDLAPLRNMPRPSASIVT
jgi:hypothetical protein